MGKVVRAVFDETKHDITPWIGALNIAHKKKVPVNQLSQWLADNGGVNGVRRNVTLTKDKATDECSREELIDKAAVQCEGLPSLAVINIATEQTVKDFAPEGHTHDHYAVALCVHENGQMKVVHYTSAKGLVNEYLARIGVVVPEMADNTANQHTLEDVKVLIAA